jgi:hypothetical protein
VKWSKPFSELLPLYPAPALEDIIRFAFFVPRWKVRMMGANHPMAYLRSVLDHVEGDRCRYEEKEQAAGRTRTASATAAPARDIEDEEDFEQEAPSGSNEIEIVEGLE